MRRRLSFLTLAMLALPSLMSAQSLYLYQGNVTTVIPAAEAGTMRYIGGTTLQISGRSFATQTIDSIVYRPAVPNVQQVSVVYNGAVARVYIPLSLSNDVTASIQGANVEITSAAKADPEIEYELSGASPNGSFTQTGEYKCRLRLNGLDLTSTEQAAISVQNGKRIAIALAEGTVNTLRDGASGSQRACFFIKGHAEIEGGGTLRIAGNARHAFASNEYTLVKRTTGSIDILSAASDGIHCRQYFKMNGGELRVANTAGDCIQAEITSDAADELNGQILVAGGKLNLTVSGEDVKGLKSDSLITISGGTLVLTASGAGAKGIGAGTDLEINQADGTTQINIAATGGEWVDPLGVDNAKCMGIKVNRHFYARAGTVAVSATGNKAKGIKVDGNYYYTIYALVSPVPEIGGMMSVLP